MLLQSHKIGCMYKIPFANWVTHYSTVNRKAVSRVGKLLAAHVRNYFIAHKVFCCGVLL